MKSGHLSNAVGLDAPALDPGPGRLLVEVPLTASRRLSVLLQAAALLSHLERVGWWLHDGWQEARIDRRGVLRGVRVIADRPRDVDHRPLADLLGQLFGEQGELSGRGQAWRAARRLGQLWGQRLIIVPADDSVAAILEAAPFLWRSTHAAGRQGLVAKATINGEYRWLVAGPAPWRRRLMTYNEHPGGCREALAGAAGERCWAALPASAARWTAGRGRSSARAPRRAVQLFWNGRFGAAECLLRGRSESGAQLLRGRCLLEGGQVGALRACLRRIEASQLDATERAELEELGRQAGWVVPGAGPAADGAPPPPGLPSLRRPLPPWRAAGRWHGLATRRLATADLKGAERALRHAARLLRPCEAPPRHQRLLLDLVEVRLRRGLVGGVRRSLTSPWTLDSSAGGERWRRRLLSARLALVHGENQQALELLVPAADDVADGWKAPGADLHDSIQVLAARALGWMGRPGAARERLARCHGPGLPGLEPEEWPAVWALGGDRRRAREAATGTSTESLWHARLSGHRGASEAWAPLVGLEPFRAARLVYDLERVEPGLTPHDWRRRAAATLRKVGNEAAAATLTRSAAGPWGPVRDYLAAADTSSKGLRRLFLDAGYANVRLVWEDGSERRVLVNGCGGSMTLAAPLGNGRLELRARRLEPVLRTLFVLAVRDLRSPVAAPAGGRRRTEAGAAGDAGPQMIGESRIFRAALERLRRLATAPIPIVILGPTGTGKELAAAKVHAWSCRRKGPFLAVNCAALSESLVLSDLFGHARGAFTGADRERRGVFETASGGTVFLDEIGDLPPAAQGLLLRVLQEQEVRRVGENRPRAVDVRVVAATHRDLESMVEAGDFRGDLYFRLAAGRVELPPLCRRGRDVLLLAERFLLQAASERGTPAPVRLSEAVRRRLLEHSWPGNVRELQNVVAVAEALAGDDPIGCADLELPEIAAGRPAGAVGAGANGGGYHRQVRALRRRLVEEALAASAGNRAGAARRLGLSRQALSYLATDLDVG